jgi:hypothetical protein
MRELFIFLAQSVCVVVDSSFFTDTPCMSFRHAVAFNFICLFFTLAYHNGRCKR